MKAPRRVPPRVGQESVWDYPRPPRIEPGRRRLTVCFADDVIVDTQRYFRVLETSHPPVYYIAIEDIQPSVLIPTDRTSFCEWKGVARYYHVMVGDFCAENAAWGYDRPSERFADLQDHVAFYAHLMDRCEVDGERVQGQLGGFYGGWVTNDIVGPFKGEAGTSGW